MSTIWHAGRQGWARMQPTEAELGQRVRRALWDFTSSTSTRGTIRDKTAVAVIRGQYPATRGLFSDAALVAVLREPQAGTCSWDAYRILAAANGEEMPSPSPALHGLLGSQCRRCQTYFEAREIAERQKALAAAGYQRSPPVAPTGSIWAAGQKAPPPSYYRPGRPTGGRR